MLNLGSAGAWTPCHQDSFGFNIVAQIRGRTRWVLFPPGDDLKPTRMPYMDASVFSQLDVIGGDPRLIGTHPRVVELQPGDVLLVPPKWWYSVQCINPADSEAERVSVSVNKWIDGKAEGDIFEQFKGFLAIFMAHLLNQQSLLGEESFCNSARVEICETPTDILVRSIREAHRRPRGSDSPAALKNGQPNGVEPAAKKARITRITEVELFNKTYERVCQLGETVPKMSAVELIVKCRAARADLISSKDEEYNWSSSRAETPQSDDVIKHNDPLTPPPNHHDFGAAFLEAICDDAVLSAIAARVRDVL